jgi:hypothetical protein
MVQATGLSVDNYRGRGRIESDAAISEADLMAGRFDGAEVRIWLVELGRCPGAAQVFRGTLGEVTIKGAEFRPSCAGWPNR